VSLPKQHVINFLLNNHYSKNVKPYCLSIDKLIDKQYLKIKSLIVDTNNCLNKVHPLFNRHYKLPRFHLVDNFPNCFSFHIVNFNDTETISAYLQSLDNILEKSFLNLNIILIISDTSIKDNVATFISYILSS